MRDFIEGGRNSDRILLRYYNMSQEQLAGWSEWTEGLIC